MLFPELKAGKFIERLSRFSARVEIDNVVEKVYVPNSGRMKELLLPGVTCFVVENNKVERTTKFDLVVVDFAGTLVSVDSRVPNLILERAVKDNAVPIFAGQPLLEVKREATYLHSRFDFRVTTGGETDRGVCYIEAKSVTLVTDGVARFPDAPTERGSKHLLELTEAVKEGHRGCIIFIVQRPDAVELRPNAATDPEFAYNLHLAREKGVEVYAFKCAVSIQEIKMIGEIPVIC